MVGIPRDSWVPLSVGGTSKMNAALIYGGAKARSRPSRATPGCRSTATSSTGSRASEAMITADRGMRYVAGRAAERRRPRRAQVGTNLLDGQTPWGSRASASTWPTGTSAGPRNQGVIIRAAVMARSRQARRLLPKYSRRWRQRHHGPHRRPRSSTCRRACSSAITDLKSLANEVAQGRSACVTGPVRRAARRQRQSRTFARHPRRAPRCLTWCGRSARTREWARTDVRAIRASSAHGGVARAGRPRTRSRTTRRCSSSGSPSWCSRRRRQLVGCGALHVMWEDLAEIRTLAVRPEAKGGGVGSALLEALVERRPRARRPAAVLPDLRGRLLQPARVRGDRGPGRRPGGLRRAAALLRRGRGGVPRPRAGQAEHPRQHPDAPQL